MKTLLTPHACRFFLFPPVFLYSIGNAAANIDTFSFCTNSCQKPGPCSEANVAAQCQKMCSDENTWTQAASLQLGKSSKEFRMEKNPGKKKGMLSGSPIGQCLGLVKEPGKEKEKELAKVDPSSLLPAEVSTNTAKTQSRVKDDLCAAAIRKEMGDLQHDKEALQTQNEALGAALKAMERASGG